MLKTDIEKLILFDKNNLILAIEALKKELGLDEKIGSLAKFIDDIESIYITNLDIYATELDVELREKSDKKLELRCYIDGKKTYLKGFGRIGKIEIQMLKKIFMFLNLVRLIKSINESAFYASQYYRTNKLWEKLGQ